MKIGFFLFLSSVYDYVNLYASFDIKDNTDMIKFKKSKTDSPNPSYGWGNLNFPGWMRTGDEDADR